jgi:hypothetical protein
MEVRGQKGQKAGKGQPCGQERIIEKVYVTEKGTSIFFRVTFIFCVR